MGQVPKNYVESRNRLQRLSIHDRDPTCFVYQSQEQRQLWLESTEEVRVAQHSKLSGCAYSYYCKKSTDFKETVLSPWTLYPLLSSANNSINIHFFLYTLASCVAQAKEISKPCCYWLPGAIYFLHFFSFYIFMLSMCEISALSTNHRCFTEFSSC